jgi:hypothetical protein
MLTLSDLQRLPSFGLLLSLAAMILLEPLCGLVRGAVPILAALHLGVLWLAVRLVASTRDEMTVTRLLAAPTILLNLGSLIVDQPGLAMADLAMRIVFYAHVIRCLLAYVLRDTVVTVDELFAATCTYVLLAMMFACVYGLLEMHTPGSFSLPAASESNRATRWDLLYFSFTVLTSTGFGDIHPLARQAQAVVVIEQVTGVMYVAILIARLTGMILTPRSPEAD